MRTSTLPDVVTTDERESEPRARIHFSARWQPNPFRIMVGDRHIVSFATLHEARAFRDGYNDGPPVTWLRER